MEQWFDLLRSPVYNLDVNTQEWVYRSFSQFVYKDIVFIINDHELTKDIIQEAFIKITKQGPKLRNKVNIPGWVKKVTRNTTIDFLRKWKLDRQIVSNAFDKTFDMLHNEISVATEVEVKVRNELLYQALNELKPDYRRVLVLFYFEGNSYRDICKELNLSETVLSQRLARARKKLLQNFLRKWANYDERV
ncbi:RNA polymerase sigma factor SigM [compost metagenome]